MPKFYLIDHSLKIIGGHHYEYALHMLNAAERAGFTPVLAANRKFVRVSQVPASWQMTTPFRLSSYSKQALIGGLSRWLGNEPVPDDTNTLWKRQKARLGNVAWQVGEWRRIIRGDARSRSFQRGLKKLFQWMPPEPGDHILIGTLNELDVIGAQRYWRSQPESQLADWHMHFHYPVEPDWKADPDLSRYYMRRLGKFFSNCRAEFPNHRLHLYTTTDPLAEQYNRLKSVPVRSLPYPVSPFFLNAKVPHRAGTPLKVTCAGGVREEKGIGVLSTLLNGVWAEYFVTERAQLVMQAESEHKLPGELRAYWNQAETARTKQVEQGITQPFSPMKLMPCPLDTQDYRRLIVGSDIGLLLYDRKGYQARCSGVLAEMLSAGIPVLVPAGCWLAEQISEEVYGHLDSLAEGKSATGGGVIKHPAELTTENGISLSFPNGQSDLYVRLNWESESERREFLRVEVRPFDVQNKPLPILTEILTPSKTGKSSSAWFPLPADVARCELHCGNAYNELGVQVTQGETKIMSATPGKAGVPLGSVGLIVSDEGRVPQLLANMIENYSHFERTATAFAEQWAAEHSPDRLVQQMTAPDRDPSVRAPHFKSVAHAPVT